MEQLYCVACEQPLMTVPIFNGDSPDFPPSFLFCANPMCPRQGLLTVMYKASIEKPSVEKEIKKVKKKKTILRSKVKKKKSVKSKHKTI